MSGPRAVLLEAPGRHRIVATDPTPPGPGEALVRVAAAGVCGSDRELAAGTRPAGYARYPVVPGHEWSGTVEAVGPGVRPELVGARVVGEGIRACLTCANCRAGDTNLCQAPYEETGFTLPGAFADYLTLPARLLHPLPPGADLRAAALLEPATCVMAAVGSLRLEPGERAAVVGGGTLGMLAVQLIAAHSPAELLVVDPRSERAAVAERLGATAFRTPDGTAPLEGTFDVAVETAGAARSALAAAALVRRGGRVALVGIPGGQQEGLAPAFLVVQQLTVTTAFGAPPAVWAKTVRAFSAGVLNPAPLITHELPLEAYGAALRLLDGRPGVGKVLLRP